MSIHRSLYHALSIVVVITMLFSGVSLPFASAQGPDGIERQVNPQTGKVSFIGPENGQALPASNALGMSLRPQDPAMALAKRYAPEFGLKDPARDLKQIKSDQSNDGRITARYQQNYQGIPVMGGELIVNTNRNGDLYSMNGEVSSDLSLSIQPTLTAEQAKETALQATAKWYQKAPEEFIASQPELWIYDEKLLRPSTRPAELVWRMEVTSVDNSLPVRELILVNAQRGHISLHFNQIDTAWDFESSPDGIQENNTAPILPDAETSLTTQALHETTIDIPAAEAISTQAIPAAAPEEFAALAGATWYVSTTGNDSNSCSISTSPCLTIDGAIAKATTGDIIRVASGTYTNTTGNVVTISKGITLSGGWNSTFSSRNGASIIDGGGMRNGVLVNASGATVVVEYFVIQNSYTGADSGGVYLYGANFTLKNSSVINNHAGIKGAGIFMIGDASLTLLNSTISGNHADSSGGGIYIVNGTVSINNSTIVYNTTSGTGGGITRESGTVSIKNSILAKNTATTTGPECSGSIGTSDHNIIGTTAGCTVTSGTGDKFNVDPVISSSLVGTLPLHRLQPGSPAINAGDNTTCLSTDQRGGSRPHGGTCDIGAYEFGTEVGLFVASGSNQSTDTGAAFALPLKVYLINSSGSPASGTTITFTAPSSGASGIFANTGTRITTAVTNSNGYATSAVFTANNQGGEYVIAVTGGGYSTTFTLSNADADYYVSPSGSDSNSCTTTSSPCQTIRAAVVKAATDDLIKVANGTYTGTGAEVLLIDKRINISGGWNSSFTIQVGLSTLDGEGARRGVTVNNGVTVLLEYFKIINGNHQAGGGVSNGGNLTINNSLISNNSGSGIFTWGSSLTINNSSILNNANVTDGGGIYSYSTVFLNNSTIAGNTALKSGGGIYAGTGLVANNSTITRNFASTGAGISGGGTFKNSILAGNVAAHGANCSGSITSAGNNIVGSGCNVNNPSADLLNTDPRLSTDLINSPGYYALLPDSPAINAGNPSTCLATDIRSVARLQGGICDVGAYEYKAAGTPASFGISSGSDQRIAPTFSSDLPLVIYVIDSQGSPVSNIPITFTAPASGASGLFANSTNTVTVSTNSGGIAASSLFTANSQRGNYSITATAQGLSGLKNFVLANAAWYVSPEGNDSNTCNIPSTPCQTIDGALGKANPGDSIEVVSGTYTPVSIMKSIKLLGGWNSNFTARDGFSVIDGSTTSDGVEIHAAQVAISRFLIQNSTFGINHTGGNLIFDQGAFLNNNSGIYNAEGIVTFRNTTLSGTHPGSAILNPGGLVKIQYSTITNNISESPAIVSLNGYASIEIANSILAGNSSTAGNNGDCRIGSGGIRSNGYNIFGSSPGCEMYGSSPFVPHATDQVGVDPQLFPLFPTGFHQLPSNSPAVNAANSAGCPSVDQRGRMRPVGIKCDIGAIEYSNSTGTTPSYIKAYQGLSQTIITGSLSSPLRAVVFDARGDTVSGAIVTFTAPPSGPSARFTSNNANVVTSITDANGIATSPPLKVNTTVGSYQITASVNGVAHLANFQFTNIAQPVLTYTANRLYILPGSLLCNEAAVSCTNGDNLHADKAHLYAIGTASFYLAKHNRVSVDDDGMPIISSLQYCGIVGPCPYPNAFWNGGQVVYGDAYGFPLADDLVAHELTHGVTQYESNLFYYYQSGAINESFSDLWGEYYDQTNGQGNDAANVKWLIGEDVSGQGATRSMSNPAAYSDPDKMSSPLYYEGRDDSGGIHINSGINNKAVYLMVNGGTFNSKTVTALGWDKTAAIYYEVNTSLLSSGADYSDLYYALQQACSKLIGQKGITTANCAEVKDALDAVEMNGQPAPNFNPHAPLCTTAGTVPLIRFADDLETGTSKWVFNNGTDVRWQLDSPYGPYAQSGLHSLYADDYPPQVSDTTAALTAITIPANAYLHFSQAYEFETGYLTGNPTLHNFDGGVLEYKTNSSSIWVDAGSLIDYNGYKGKIDASANWWENNPLVGRSAFVGSSHGYISTRLNLTSLAGKTVAFRWRMGLDMYGYAWGWWVDNIKIYTCGAPPPGAFNKTAPASGTVNQLTSPTLIWGASSRATSYQYCYDATNDNACANWVSNGTATSKVLSGLSPNTTYYWHVRALNSSGATYANGNATAFWSFRTLAPPGAFNKTAPSNGSTGVSLNTTLTWSSSPFASSYQYCYDTINDNQCNRTWTNAPSTSVNISNLGTNTMYYWQVRAVNASGTTNADNQSWGSFKTTSTLPAGLTGMEVFVDTNRQGKYTLTQGQSLRESYTGVNNGPVEIVSTNAVPLIGAERVIYKVKGVQTSFTELMGLPNGQLDTTYYLPWYNNVDLDTQLRIANATNTPASVTVTIGGVPMPPLNLAAGESTRVSYPDVNNGPVKIESNQKIVAAERVIYTVQRTQTSFSEMMALPEKQLDTTYWLPWYNNVDLDTQLRIGNVSDSTATVHIFIGGNEVTPGEGITLLEGESTRLNYPVNDGPVQIVSDQNIVAAERVIYKVNKVQTSFSEMMALPNDQLDTTYWLPWYNNVDLDTQLRFANATNSTATVHIYVGGVEMEGSPFTLEAGESTRQSFAGINDGPVQMVSDQDIVAAERVIYKVNGAQTSFTEMMALPNDQLDATYWFPWYNNVDLDTQLRFGVP